MTGACAVKIEYCPTTKMVADILTKNLNHILFQKFARLITGNVVEELATNRPSKKAKHTQGNDDAHAGTQALKKAHDDANTALKEVHDQENKYEGQPPKKAHKVCQQDQQQT